MTFWVRYITELLRCFLKLSVSESAFPLNIYLFKVNNRNTRKRCEICLKLIIKALERCHWRFTISITIREQLLEQKEILEETMERRINLLEKVANKAKLHNMQEQANGSIISRLNAEEEKVKVRLIMYIITKHILAC